MKDNDETPCRRYRFKWRGEKHYLAITRSSITHHPPNQTFHGNMDVYSLIEALNRIISKSVNTDRPLSWGEVAYQLSASSKGEGCITDKFAKVIRDEVQAMAKDLKKDPFEIEFDMLGDLN